MTEWMRNQNGVLRKKVIVIWVFGVFWVFCDTETTDTSSRLFVRVSVTHCLTGARKGFGH